MRSTTMLAALTLGVGALMYAPSAVPAADAAVLEVQFTGMDLYMGFDGKLNIQTGPVAGDIDELDAATFYVDGSPIGTITGNMSAGVGLPTFHIPAAGGSDSNNGVQGYFSLDFDTTSYDQGWLDLAVDDEFIVTAYYTGNRVGLTIVGTNTGIKRQQPMDRLSGWPGFEQFETIKFSFSSSNLTNVENDGNILTRFAARGSGTLSQDGVIPEPAGLSLLGIGALGLLRRRRA